MNNSEKQAAAFEPKWTCEEPKPDTPPDCCRSSSLLRDQFADETLPKRKGKRGIPI